MKTYSCNKITTDIVIDGNLAKPEWLSLEGMDLAENLTGEKPWQATMAKMAWNRDFLYIAFQGEDDVQRASYRGFNDPLYEEDVVEIFIDDDRDLKTYLEIEVNPRNAVLHYLIHNDLQGEKLQFARIEPKVRSAVAYDQLNRIWKVEIAVPFAEFITATRIPPRDGDRWLMNLFRIDRAIKPEEDEYSAWSPTGKLDFHRPEFFGALVFKED